MNTKTWCPTTNAYVPIPSDPSAVKVWNMYTQEWVVLQKYMRYAAFIWTNGYSQEQWDIWFPPPEKVSKGQ
jgi:hypothetical protein